jgi:hypothetical protein
VPARHNTAIALDTDNVFHGADEEREVREHERDLSRERGLEVLTDDLRTRGRSGEGAPGEAELMQTIVQEHAELPPAALSAPAAS